MIKSCQRCKKEIETKRNKYCPSCKIIVGREISIKWDRITREKKFHPEREAIRKWHEEHAAELKHIPVRKTETPVEGDKPPQ